VINSDLRSISNLPEVLTALNSALNLAWTGNSKLDKAIDKASSDMKKLLKDSDTIELK
jgi:multiple sugar transport system substrate-binding protein